MPHRAKAEFVELDARQLAHEQMTSFLSMLLAYWSSRYGGMNFAFGYNDGVPNVRFYRGGNAPSLTRIAGSGRLRPDLVIEVIPRKARAGDPVKEHAAEGVPELWLVDPDEKTLERRVLDAALGVYGRPESFRGGATFRPPGFDGLEIPLAKVWQLSA